MSGYNERCAKGGRACIAVLRLLLFARMPVPGRLLRRSAARSARSRRPRPRQSRPGVFLDRAALDLGVGARRRLLRGFASGASLGLRHWAFGRLRPCARWSRRRRARCLPRRLGPVCRAFAPALACGARPGPGPTLRCPVRSATGTVPCLRGRHCCRSLPTPNLRGRSSLRGWPGPGSRLRRLWLDREGPARRSRRWHHTAARTLRARRRMTRCGDGHCASRGYRLRRDPPSDRVRKRASVRGSFGYAASPT